MDENNTEAGADGAASGGDGVSAPGATRGLWRSGDLVHRLVRLHNAFLFWTVAVAVAAHIVGSLLPWKLVWPVRLGLEVVRLLVLAGALAWSGLQTNRRIEPLTRAEALPMRRIVVAFGRTKRGAIRALGGAAIFSAACLLVSRGIIGFALAVIPFIVLIVPRPSQAGLEQFCAFVLYRRLEARGEG